MKINYKNYKIETIGDCSKIPTAIIQREAKLAIKQLKDSRTKDMPVKAPAFTSGTITHENGTTFNSFKESIKKRNNREMNEKFNDILASAKKDLANADVLKSKYLPEVLTNILNDYIDACDMGEEKGIDSALILELKEIIAKLENKWDLIKWKEIDFSNLKLTPSESRRTERELLRSNHDSKQRKVLLKCHRDSKYPYLAHHKNAKLDMVKDRPIRKSIKSKLLSNSLLCKDSNLSKAGWDIEFLVTPTKLKKAYGEAKSGTHVGTFVDLYNKVCEDLLADYNRVINGQDNYLEVYPKKVLKDIISYYKDALRYAKEIDSAYSIEHDLDINFDRFENMLRDVAAQWAEDID